MADPQEKPEPTTADVHEADVLGLVEELFTESKQEQRKYIRRWNKYYRSFRNRTWGEGRASHLPSPQAPQIFPTYHCVPEEAEALTRDGWKRWDRCDETTEFLTYNLEEDRTEWQQAGHVSVFPFEGKLQSIRGFLATEGHRWPVVRNDRTRRIRTGEELIAQDRLLQAASSHDFPEDSVLSPREAAILGWIVTDGTFAIRDGKTQRKPWAQIYQRGSNYLGEILRLLGSDAGSVREDNRYPDNYAVYVRTSVLYPIVWRGGFRSKADLLHIVPRLNREATEAMWDAMLKAEGHSRPDGTVVFCQNPGPVFDAFQMLCLFLGYRVNLTSNNKHHVGGFRSGVVRPNSGRLASVQETTYEPYEGRVWCPTTPNGTWVMRQNGKVVITGNSLSAYMTDQFPTFYAAPSLDTTDFEQPPPPDIVEQKREDAEKALASWWVTSGAHTQTEMALLDALTFGAGILKTGYDLIGYSGLGDPAMKRADPYNILPDPNASSFEESRYVLEVSRVPVFDVIKRFPERGHLVEPDRQGREEFERPKLEGGGGIQSQSGINLAATGVTGNFPGTATAGISPRWAPGTHKADYSKTVRLIEAWVRREHEITVPQIVDGERIEDVTYIEPYWEYIATASGVVLTPEITNPFDHGQLPYIRLPMVEIGEFWSMGLTEQLLPAQVAINRLLAAMQTSAELTGNPILLEPDSAGIARTKLVNRPGGRLRVNAGAAQFVRWLDPPQMSANVIQLIQFYLDQIDRISGISAVARGGTLRRREAAASVDAVQEASFARIRAVLRNYENALRVAADQVLSNMVQFTIEPRTLPLMGAQGSESLELGHKHFWVMQPNGEDVPLKFRTAVLAGSTLPLSNSARTAQAMELRKNGDIDGLELLKVMGWPDYERVYARAQQSRGQMVQQQAIEKGLGGS